MPSTAPTSPEGCRVSHGCICLYPEDIAKLFVGVRTGTEVTVADQMVGFGWRAGELYLEIHPTIHHLDELEAAGRFTSEGVPGLQEQIVER